MFQLSTEPSNRRPEAAAPMLDEMDVKILRILQQDCTRSVADIGKEVGLSTTPCWRRIQKLEETGVIERRVVAPQHAFGDLDVGGGSKPLAPRQ